MNTWWLAIDRTNGYSSYDELKHRHVIAQGWSELGDLVTICPLVERGEQAAFITVIDALELIAYGKVSDANDDALVPRRVLWDLLRMQRGDIVVGIEGTTVKGICELNANGWESYRYQHQEIYEYAQTIGFPAKWIDWDTNVFGFTPKTPARSVPGVRGLVNESEQVMAAWERYKAGHQAQ